MLLLFQSYFLKTVSSVIFGDRVLIANAWVETIEGKRRDCNNTVCVFFLRRSLYRSVTWTSLFNNSTNIYSPINVTWKKGISRAQCPYMKVKVHPLYTQRRSETGGKTVASKVGYVEMKKAADVKEIIQTLLDEWRKQDDTELIFYSLTSMKMLHVRVLLTLWEAFTVSARGESRVEHQ